MALLIAFEPSVDDGFDDYRCRISVENGSFCGETRFRNVSPESFAELVTELSRFPIEAVSENRFFGGLLRIRVEPVDHTGHLRLQVRLAQEYDLNLVEIEAPITYANLANFTGDMSRIIKSGEGQASL